MAEESDISRGRKRTHQDTAACLEIAVSSESERWAADLVGTEALCRRAVSAALAADGPHDERLEVSVVLADDRMVRELNRDNRGIDRPTNVLAFPGDPAEEGIPDGAPRLLGDIVLANETIAREASEFGKPFEDRLAHLVVHGTLHLLGYDHQTPADAEAMESIEIYVLAQLGVLDPYTTESNAVVEVV